jgi:hypothetical protein
VTQLLSVIVPVFCNETTLVELRARLTSTLLAVEDLDFEIILVDDASSDRSWAVIEDMTRTDPRVVGLRLVSNVGQLRAICAGLEIARGEVLMVMDADLEHPPEAVPRLLGAFRDGHDLVVAQRTGRSSTSVRFFGSSIVNLLARMLRLPATDVGSSFMMGTPDLAVDMRRMVDRTGRQMFLPRVFDSASNPAVVEVELAAESTTSAYALLRVVRLGGEFLVAEVGPVLARKVLLASVGVLALGMHPRLRRRALHLAASMVGIGFVGLLVPRAFKRNDTAPLYEVATRAGGGLPAP